MSLALPMPRRRRLAVGLVLGLFVWSVFLPVASAQQTRTLDIRDGTVYVDGRAVPDDQLPPDLNLEGIQAHYRFLGIQRPVIELNGRLFAIDDGLTPVTEEEVRQENASVILRDAPVGASAARAPTEAAAESQRDYLDEIQQSSRQLYERLVRERRMERETQQLARAIRLLPEGAQRQAKIDSLRSMLNDIFELKQENRRREIQHLQQQIQDLQESIQKREKMRDLMIDRRLKQLLTAAEGR